MKKVLLIVDMQNDFIDGALGTPEAQAIVPRVIERVKNFDGAIFFTRDTHGENYLETQEGKSLPVKHCIKGTHGWEICDGLLPFVKGNVIDKPTFGSLELAKKIKTLAAAEDIDVTLIGLCTDICVISNAMLIKAFLPEAKVTVESNLCAGVSRQSHLRALEAMQMCQISII